MLVAWLAMNLLQQPAVPGAWELNAKGVTQPVPTHVSPSLRPLVNMWSRWDGGWYFDVAAHGYKFMPGQPSNTAFYPLYPMLMRVVHLFIRSNSDASWFQAGIIVSNLCLAGALCYLHLLVRLDHDMDGARRAVFYVLVFPTTLFLSAVYTESLFLGLAIASYYYARRNKWVTASLIGAAATLSRAPGLLLFGPLAYEYLAQRQFQWRKVRCDFGALLLIPLALVAYSVYLRLQFGNLLAISAAQGTWGRILTPQWIALKNVFAAPLDVHSGAHSIVDLMFTLVFVLITIGIAFRLPASYALYSGSVLLFITAWGTFISVPRYGLSIFPAFIFLAVCTANQLFHRLLSACFFALAALFMVLFALWSWVA
jgi:hypothetical protein